MKRHLIWIIAASAAVGVAVPAFAAMQPTTAPEDTGIPGEVRGNCDEPEHANDAECWTVMTPSPPMATTPTTIELPTPTPPSTTLDTSTSVSISSTSRGARAGSIADRTAGGTTPSTSVSDDVPDGTVPDDRVQSSVPGDISGPCDEVEHADDPRCTGSAVGVGDDSGQRADDGTDDHSGHGSDDAGTDDHSGHGSDDGTDDHSGHGSDD